MKLSEKELKREQKKFKKFLKYYRSFFDNTEYEIFMLIPFKVSK